MDTPCIEFTGYIGNHGYGVQTIDGRQHLAHRVAFALAAGVAVDDLKACVLHRCDNRKCINAEHLFEGTKGDNAADRERKGRTSKGEALPQARLCAAQIQEIRRRWAAGCETQRQIGRAFGVSNKTISKIVRRQRWSHV